MTDTARKDGLPELPEPSIYCCPRSLSWFLSGKGAVLSCATKTAYWESSPPAGLYTADQMRAYGEACRRASPSVGGVRFLGRQEAEALYALAENYGQGDYFAVEGANAIAEEYGFGSEVRLRLNPSAEVGVMVGNVPIAAKIMSFLQIEPGVCLDDAGINPANLARAITLANTYKDARDEIDQHKAPENRTNDTDAYEPLPHSAASPDRERR